MAHKHFHCLAVKFYITSKHTCIQETQSLIVCPLALSSCQPFLNKILPLLASTLLCIALRQVQVLVNAFALLKLVEMVDTSPNNSERQSEKCRSFKHCKIWKIYHKMPCTQY